jgi:hypothetical protein
MYAFVILIVVFLPESLNSFAQCFQPLLLTHSANPIDWFIRDGMQDCHPRGNNPFFSISLYRRTVFYQAVASGIFFPGAMILNLHRLIGKQSLNIRKSETSNASRHFLKP